MNFKKTLCLITCASCSLWAKSQPKIKEDPEILCNLGMAYLNNGDLDDAVYYIERAYELDPQDEITIACLRELDKYR